MKQICKSFLKIDFDIIFLDYSTHLIKGNFIHIDKRSKKSFNEIVMRFNYNFW